MEQHTTTAGFLVAISDVALSAALSLIHSQPAHPWSVHELARKIGMSRSAFAARFKEVMGISPMQYLTHWRMQKARELFLTEDHSVATVCLVCNSCSANRLPFPRARKARSGSSRLTSSALPIKSGLIDLSDVPP